MFKKILFLEDEDVHLNVLMTTLKKHPYQVFSVNSIDKCFAILNELLFDLIIVGSHFIQHQINVLSEILEKHTLPAFVLTHADDNYDYLSHLSDQIYIDLIKIPVSEKDFIDRINRTIHLSDKKKGTVEINLHPLRIIPHSYEVFIHEKPVNLTKAEFEILYLLASQPGKVFEKKEMHRLLWSEDYLGDPNALNVHICNLRKKIEKDPTKPRLLLTKWGFGYQLKHPDTK
jgi:DNA-binding response OmpR family regulator